VLAVLFTLRIVLAFCSPSRYNVALLAVCCYFCTIHSQLFSTYGSYFLCQHSIVLIYHGDTGLLYGKLFYL